MIIIYRASEANKSPGSISDGSQDKARWNGKKKDEIVTLLLSSNISKDWEWIKKQNKF